MLSQQTRNDSFLVGTLLILLVTVGYFSLGTAQSTEAAPDIDDTEAIKVELLGTEHDTQWVFFTHESGAAYTLKKTAIIGFSDPGPNAASLRRGILLSNGIIIRTSLLTTEFQKILAEDAQADVNVIYEREGASAKQ